MLPRFPFRLVAVSVAALIFFVLPSVVSIYTDWLWFGEVGYQSVYLRTLAVQSALWAIAFAIVFAVLFGNFRLALKTARFPRVLTWSTGEGQVITLPAPTQIGAIVKALAAGLALLFAFAASGHWMTWLLFRNSAPFGDVDPILGHDVAFYMFRLPFLEFVRSALQGTIAVSFLGATGLYLLSGAVAFATGPLHVASAARRHLSLLGACWFLLLAAGAALDIPALLIRPGGIVYGASYVDVAVRIPALKLLVVAALAGAALALYHAFSDRFWPIAAAIGLYLVVSFGGDMLGATIQRFSVTPNEQVKQEPYIVYNIAGTRKAFGIADVEEQELTGEAGLTRADIERNAATLKNVRLWDHRPLLDTFGQLQEIRPYYDFAYVDNDRYTIDGEYRQIMLSARELNSSALPNRTWINERLTFTHGYGLTLGPVNQVSQEGLPVLFIKDLPPVSSVDLRVEEPSLYFGELSSDYVIVRTNAREFHYPKGEDNIFARYEGRGGVPVDTLFRKLLFSLHFGAYQIFLSNDLGPESRVLYNRQIRARATTIAPFLRYDEDPYLVIADGRLFWMQDAYTISDRYPYSTPAPNGINYIRNSVKVVTDAYHGTTTFYLADPADPIAIAYGRIFPELLRPLDDMPSALREHIRYPEELFSLQTVMYRTFHMTNPAVYYNREDQWEIPSLEAEGDRTPMQPYYTIMKLPGAEAPEFIQMLPFTPGRRDNISAWMVARSDAAHYGKLVVFKFPKQTLVFGPRQIVARINQDQEISPQLTLWNQQGSEVIQGTLLVIPIEESLIYIRPLYLRSAGGRIPELKRVIVAYQSQIVMEETLEEGLDRIFGPATGSAPAQTPSSGAPPTVESAAPTPPRASGGAGADLAGQARAHYQRALEAQRAGNWALYGEEIRQLGEIIERMAVPAPRQ